MPRVGQGGTATLHSEVTDLDGNPADATSLSVTLLDPLGSVVPGFPIVLADLVHDATGMYHFDWVVGSMQPTGIYQAVWSGATIYGPVGGTEEWIVVTPASISFGTPGPIPDSYLAPGRFGLMRMGSKVPSDIEMISVLQEASAIADAYCIVPREFTFFGGTVVNEEHRWRYPLTNMDIGQRRIYPLRKPLLEPILSFQIVVSAGAVATLPVSALVVNHIENWVEVTSLALASSSGLFGVTGWIVPIGGLANPLALISYNYGRSYVETDRSLALTVPGGLTYQAPHGSWTSDAVVVKANGIVVDPAGTYPYTIDTDNGWIIFSTSAPAGRLTVSYVHLLPREIPLATAMIAAHLLGDAALRAKGMQGLAQIKAGEIMLSKGRMMPTASDLEITVPDAARLLDGFRFWSWG